MEKSMSFTIDRGGNIVLPCEVKEQFDFQKEDYFKVSVQPNNIVLVPSKAWFDNEPDEGLINALCHEGLLIDA